MYYQVSDLRLWRASLAPSIGLNVSFQDFVVQITSPVYVWCRVSSQTSGFFQEKDFIGHIKQPNICKIIVIIVITIIGTCCTFVPGFKVLCSLIIITGKQANSSILSWTISFPYYTVRRFLFLFCFYISCRALEPAWVNRSQIERPLSLHYLVI